MAEGQADETIITRFLVEADDAMKSILALREEVNKTRQDLKAFAEATKTSYRDAAKGLIDAAKQARDVQIESIRQTGQFQGQLLTGPIQSEAVIAKLKEDYTSYKDVVTRALAEITQAQKQYDESVKQSAKERSAEQQQNVKLQTELEKQSIKEREAQLKQRIILEKELNKQAAEAQREYIQVTRQGYGTMSEGAQQFGKQVETIREQIKTISQQTGQSFSQIGQQMVGAGANVRTVNEAIRQLNAEAKQTPGIFGQIGSALQIVFGLGIFQLVRGLIRNIKELVKGGLEFSKAMFQMEIGIRALRRAGVDITFADVSKQLDSLREKFKSFTTKELVVGSAAFLNLIRDMGFTKDEIFSLQDAIATLALVNGRSMDEVQRTVALAISSGYTEGLQRLGVSINRVTIAERAAQLGWKGGYLALTEQQRAYATLNLILEKTQRYQDDLAAYYETSPGKIAVLNASLKETADRGGRDLIPILGVLADLLNRLIDPEQGRLFADLTGLIRTAGLFLTDFTKVAENMFAVFGSGFKDLEKINTFLESVSTVWDNALNSMELAAIEWMGAETFAKRTGQSVEDVKARMIELEEAVSSAFEGAPPVAEIDEEAIKQVEIVEGLIGEIEKIEEDSAQRRRDILIGLYRDLAQITEDGARRREEIERNYAQKLADIERDAQRGVAKARRDLASDLEKIGRDVQQREEEARRKFRQREIEDEEKFQLRLKKLREDFIFDLEDAVRARDAKQIRRLTRQFNKEHGQLIDQRELEKSQRQRDFEEELEEIRRQADERRTERLIQYQQRLEDIRIQRQQQLQEAEIQHKQDLEDLRRRLEEQRQERLKKFQQQQQDLQRSINDRLQSIAKGLISEYNLTQKGAKAVYDLLRAYFGPNGYVDQLYKYYQQNAANQNLSFPAPTFQEPNPAPGGFAHGGTFVASRPISRTFGEVPELVSITPLNGLGRNAGKFFGDISGGDISAKNGKLAIDLFLSPDLEARIRERSMQDMSDVLVKVQRSR